MEITADILQQIAPGGKQTGFKLFPELAVSMNLHFPKFGIETLGELRHFITQAAHETNSFNTLKEYASGNQYEGRKDLGNTIKGDGIRFKGRGVFQTTGRNNYLRLGDIEGDPKLFLDNPELLEKPNYAVWSACIYWNDRHLNDYANMPDTNRLFIKKLGLYVPPVQYLSYRINGGFNGLEERKTFYVRACSVIK